MQARLIEDLRWKKFPVTSDGFVCLVDVMGDDSSITQAARVSYGNDSRELDCQMQPEDEQRKNRDLIRYLMRHRHSTPFEMAEVKLLVRVPMDCWRQWIRHRTANVNEYSTRYTEAIDSQQMTLSTEWRLQATDNKQGSSGILTDGPEGYDCGDVVTYTGEPGTPERKETRRRGTAGELLSSVEYSFQQRAKEVYQQRLRFGIAKEQARKDLPLSTYTEAYWKCDLHNILHFLALRMDSHAQKEIRDYATTIGQEIIKPLFPLVWEAFEDYRLNAMVLTGPEISVLLKLVTSNQFETAMPTDIRRHIDETALLGKREKTEFATKLERMGLL